VERRKLTQGARLARRVKQGLPTPVASLSARYAEVVRLRQELFRVQSGLKLDQHSSPDPVAAKQARSKDADLSA
jgi:hypothetical protein